MRSPQLLIHRFHGGGDCGRAASFGNSRAWQTVHPPASRRGRPARPPPPPRKPAELPESRWRPARASSGHEIAPQTSTLTPKFREPSRPVVWCRAPEALRTPAAVVLAVEVDQQDVLSDVEHRRNPALPVWYGDFHGCVIRRLSQASPTRVRLSSRALAPVEPSLARLPLGCTPQHIVRRRCICRHQWQPQRSQ